MKIVYPNKYFEDLFTWQNANEIKDVVNYNEGLIPKVYEWALSTTKPTYTYTEITAYLGYVPENVENKGLPNGYAPLDAYSKIPIQFLPISGGYFMQKYQIPANGVADNTTGLITGLITFTLPDDFDYSKANWAQDGGIFAQYTLNSTAKTITFSEIPLANTCFIYYYQI